jgi:hypothetical protein
VVIVLLEDAMLEFRPRRPLAAVLFIGLMALAACDDEESIAPLTPTIVASNVSVDTLRGLVNAPLTQDASVKVTSSDGRPIPGVAVAWAVGSGGGSVSDATTATGPDGVASTTWTIGSEPDAVQTLTATVTGLSPVTFVAKGSAVDIYAAAAIAGDEQEGFAGEALPQTTSVRVVNTDLSPAPGRNVTFVVTAGGGSVDPATVVTDANGIATTTWTIGAGLNQTLEARVEGLPTAVVISANEADPCLAARVLGPAEVKSRSLEAGDCVLPNGAFAEFFDFVSPAVAAGTQSANVVVTMESAAFDTYLSLQSGADSVAFTDDIAAGTNTNSAIRVFLPEGTFRFSAAAKAAGLTGAYTLTSAAGGANVTGCERAFVAPGVFLTQTLEPTDCVIELEAPGFFADRYRIFLTAGVPVTVTATSQATGLDARILITSPAGAVVKDQDCCAPGSTEVADYTPTATGFHSIFLTSFLSQADDPTGAVGSYTLQVSPAP